MRRKFVCGNWKMHKTVGEAAALVGELRAGLAGAEAVQVAVAPPYTALQAVAGALAGSPIELAAQDVHWEAQGAYTGAISAAMLADVGCRHAIVGHSERRQAQHETDADVKAKAEAALASGLDVILCVGESLAVREQGRAVEVVDAQLAASLPEAVEDPASLSIAYEPIWAIGTGKVPTIEDIDEMHRALRQRLSAAYGDAAERIRILYGGSVKASNAEDIFSVEDVDGALVGGASLKAADFLPIVEAADRTGSH